MRKQFLVSLVTAGLLLAAVAQANARERELLGIKLGRPMDVVSDAFGSPTRTFNGPVPTGGGPAGAAPGGGAGAPGGGMPGGGMPGAPGGAEPGGPGGGMPGAPMGGMPGAPGMGGAGGGLAPAAVHVPQKYQGHIAFMKPEDFGGRLMTSPEAAQAAPAGGGMPGAGGGAPGMPGMPGMEMGAPGMPGGGMPGAPGGGMPGAPGGGAAGGGVSTGPMVTFWVYERRGEAATFLFGFDEDGRVNLISVGDDKPYSTTRGGRKPPFGGAKTAKGVILGDTFKKVILTYGFPESTEVVGDEVLMKYWERQGVAFTFHQDIMRVTSISVRSPEE